MPAVVTLAVLQPFENRRPFAGHLILTVQTLEELFVAIWCLVMPVTSFLIIPSIQGTTPAYVFAYGSILFVIFKIKSPEFEGTNIRYFRFALLAVLIWLGLLAGSQLGHLIDGRTNFEGAYMVNNEDDSVLFRGTLFSQSLYLAACILIFVYFRFYFQGKWMKYVIAGGYLMAAYGIYEWTYFLIFKHPGDFVSNRMFGDEHPGSWSQVVDFGGLSLLRIKSFYGEPSFYAPAIILYLIVAMEFRQRLLIGLLAFNAFFSTSTSCYVAIIVCLLFHVGLAPRGRLPAILFLVAIGLAIVALDHYFPDTFSGMFGDKISGENESGRMRMESSASTQDLLSHFSLMNWLFGLGFGYAYNQVSTAILENTGLIGLVCYCVLFLKPVFFLPRQGVSGSMKTCIFGLFFLFNLTLSEFFLPTTWMFLGIAYRYLDESERARRFAPVESPIGLPIEARGGGYR